MEIQHIYIPSVYTNCYLLCDEESKSFAVIDPGEDITADIQQFCQESGYTLRAIFLTHSHYDHIGGVAALRQAFPDVPAYIHPDDTGRYDARIPTSTLGPLTLWRDGDVVPMGNLKVEVIHTPGHTKGSVVLRCQDALFTGDTLFAGTCGRTDFPGGDYGEMMASLKRLGELEGNFRVLPGHESFSTLDQERKTNRYMLQAMGK